MKRNSVDTYIVGAAIFNVTMVISGIVLGLTFVVSMAIYAPVTLAVLVGIGAIFGIAWYLLAYTRFGERLLKR